MLGSIWEAIKGFLGGKGTTQIGRENTNVSKSVSGVSIGGDAKNLIVTNDLHLHTATPANVAAPAKFEPRPEEVDVLTRLAASSTKSLILWEADTGWVVLIDGNPLADPHDTAACLRYLEGVHRLHDYKLLINPRQDGKVFHLSSDGRDRLMQLEASNNPTKLHPHTVFFRFMGRDAGGGYSSSTKAKAEGVSYWFKLDAFNELSENVGLMALRLHYAKCGKDFHEELPTQHTGEVRLSMRDCPEVTVLTLPSREWITYTFEGGVGKDILTLADCDDIYLTAKSTHGETFRVPLAKGIIAA